jgi:hypothetical protein
MKGKSIFWSIVISILTGVVAFFTGILYSKRIKDAGINNAAIKFANSTEELILKDYKNTVKNEITKVKQMHKSEVRSEFERRFGK